MQGQNLHDNLLTRNVENGVGEEGVIRLCVQKINIGHITDISLKTKFSQKIAINVSHKLFVRYSMVRDVRGPITSLYSQEIKSRPNRI